MPEAPRIVHIGEVEPIQSGGVGYRLMRRALGITAFGINAFSADRGVQLIEEHDETGVSAGRHEELYVLLSGCARFTIDGADHDAPAGTFVFIPDPESKRAATALEDGTSAIAVGGRVGEPYEVSPWETSAALEHLRNAAEIDPVLVRRWAADDSDLDSLCDDPGFPRA